MTVVRRAKMPANADRAVIFDTSNRRISDALLFGVPKSTRITASWEKG
jgi:hypothetical protein